MQKTKLTKEFNKYYTKIGRDIIFNHTCQILIKGVKYGYEPWGTGVLLEYNNNCYILTASHVTEEQTELFTITRLGIMPIIGVVRETDLSKNKKIDIAYIILDNKTSDILKSSFIFLPQDKIQLSHTIEDSTSYLVLGYPKRNLKVEGNIIKTGAEHIITRIANDTVFNYYEYNKLTNYLVDYAGKGFDLITNNKKKINIKPRGISGCGLWYLSWNGDLANFEIDYFLIGIITDYINGKFFVLAATSVDGILSDINFNINQ